MSSDLTRRGPMEERRGHSLTEALEDAADNEDAGADEDDGDLDDWDDEEDREREAPMKDDAEYKGKWVANRISNPAYKGVRVAKQIANPEYVDGGTVYTTLSSPTMWLRPTP